MSALILILAWLLGFSRARRVQITSWPGNQGNAGVNVAPRMRRRAPGVQLIMLLRGGDAPERKSASTPSLTPTKLTPPTPTERFRKDFCPPPYRIDSVSLNIDIHEGETHVTSALVVHPQADAAGKPLDLDGELLELKSIEVNGVQLQQGQDYVLTYDGLRLLEPPADVASFELKTVVSIVPEENSKLSGLYKSGGMYVTHNEAEGFRRITYFQDRPDVMAKYDVRIEADSKYPVLLSNGNKVDSGDLGNGRHWASFSDPFRKPSYLFAAVAGDLAGVEDKFTTMNGREVQLNVWSEHDNEAFLDWPMKCLKDAMKWDEETYDREYDLDVYHIVAVNDFNMGAMENKGLNIFNTAAVLAKEGASTDSDFERVLQVVGHEYAHNWSGNRVTVRDWFQVSLKEGFTRFREQHFCQDMTSAGLRRIEEANVIRSAQFEQDAGPMAHSVRPESYTAIDNFYTVTVYNKGAEVIRMYRTLLGPELFRKAVNLYFERHDGSAATCDDFRKAMSDASGRDFSQFERWYMQAGTPTVTATAEYEASSKTYKLTLAQKTLPTANQPEKMPLHIPVLVGLFGSDGRLLTERVLELRETQQTFIFEEIPEEPVPSILRGFSAPVKVDSDAIVTPEKLAFLAANDDDPVNRWDALQRVYKAALLELIGSYQANGGDESKMTPLAPGVLKAFQATLTNEKLDPSLRAISLALPSFTLLAQEMEVIDVDAITTAIRVAQKTLAATCKSDLLKVYGSLTNNEPYAVTQEQVGARRLRNACLSYLSKLKDEDTTNLCIEQFRTATSMTDSVAALAALCDLPGDAREEALATFYKRAHEKNEVLNVNKWFQIQAMAKTPTVLADVKALMEHDAFDASNPNRYRALVATFASGNPSGFHKIDGSGYKFIADQVIEIDKRNPQVAARLASAFLLWKRYSDDRKALMKAQLERIKEEATSKDTKEIVGRSLA